ncbi:MAG: hypothetical protein ACRCV3_01335 [Desulfovibrionaceae bacterium]
MLTLVLSSCATKSGEIASQYDPPISAKNVWNRFVNNNPSTFSPFRMEQSIRIKTTSFASPTLQAISWGNAKGISRIDILTPFKTPLIKAYEGLSESVVYVIPQKTAYIIDTKDYTKLFSSIGLEMPFTLEDFFAILTGNASRVYSKYYTTLPGKNGITFILTPGNSPTIQSLYISYDNNHISWQDSTGWKIEYMVNQGRIIGLLAQHKKGHSLTTKVTRLEHSYPVTEDNLILRIPHNVRTQRVQ